MKAVLLQRLRSEVLLVFVTQQFLTRVPVPGWVAREPWNPDWLNRAVRHFPLVGAAVGAAGAAVAGLALLLWPPLVAAALAMGATVWLTSAFHEDGLADTADALLGLPWLAAPAAVGAWQVLMAALALALLVAAMRGWLRRRLGGYTGDTLGACEQLGEIVVALVFVAAWTPWVTRVAA
jgi:cobalamin synthase